MNISPSPPQSGNYATVSSSPAKRRAGRTKFQETRHAVYRGVRRRGPRRWVCEVREPNKKSRIWLGTFPTPEMAARAHDVAVMALRGPSACLNFANSALLVTNIPPPSAGARGIKLAAAEAARAFCMPEHDPSKLGFSEDVAEWKWHEMESGMQGEYCYYASMAEGMLLDPPPMPDSNWDDVDADAHVFLWT